MSDVSIVTGDLDVEITDKDGNSAKIENDQLRVRDRQITEILGAMLVVLESIDRRLARMESE